jgi:small subunit ribosomal protein S2
MKQRNKENINKLLFDKFVFYGLHLGGLKSFWNPKMKPYIVSFRNNFCILNLSLTHRNMKQSFSYLSKIILSNKKILFVGSPKGLEKKFSHLCQRYGHYSLDVYTDGFFSNFQSNKVLDTTSFKSSPSLIFFFDASMKEKVKKEILNLNIPIMAFVNSEDDISGIDYPIPANINSWKGGIFVFNLFYHLFSFPEKIS